MGVWGERQIGALPVWLVASVLCAVLVLASLAPIPAFALDLQHPKYRLQQRRNAAGQVDRLEGIKPFGITGERLKLVAVLLHAPALRAAQPGSTYRLGFYLKEAAKRVTIEVRDYERFKVEKYHYWMLPARKQYSRGFKTFDWDATLVQELRIGVQDLGAVARVSGPSYPLMAPVLLHTAPFPSSLWVQGCRFVFVPNATMTVDYRLNPKGRKSQILVQGTEEKWQQDKKQIITWDGLDHQGQAAPEGMYVLQVTAKVATLPGQPGRRIPSIVEFYYTPVIR